MSSRTMSSPSTKMGKKRTIDTSRSVKTKASKKGQSDVNEKSEKSRQATNRTGKSEKSKEVTSRTGKTVAKTTTGNTNAGKTGAKNEIAKTVVKNVVNKVVKIGKVEPKKYEYGPLQTFRNMIFQEMKDFKKTPTISEQYVTKKEFEIFVKLVRSAFSSNDKSITRRYKQLFETDINKNSVVSGGSTSNKTTSSKKQNVLNVETAKVVEKKIEMVSTGQKKNSKKKSPEKVNSDDEDSGSNMSDSDMDEDMTTYEDSDQENEGHDCDNMHE